MKKRVSFVFTFLFFSSFIFAASLSEIKKFSVDTLYNHLKANDSSVIQAVTQKKLNLNQENLLGYTVLSYAAIDNDVKLVRLLLESGAKADAGVNFPLYEVCWATGKQTSRYEVINLLLSHGANINKKHKNTSLTPLMATIKMQHGEYALYLISKGAKINLTDADGESALMLAVDYKDKASGDKLIRALIENGADVNKISKNGHTALSIACYNGDDSVVKLLLENKASTSLSAKNKNEIPILNACYSGNIECVRLLMKYGADINVKDLYGSSALIVSCVTKDNPELVKLCLSYGADVNYVDPASGHTAFTLAAIWNHPKQMDVLFENGADTTYINPEIGDTLLFIISNGNKESTPPLYTANELGGAIHGIENGMFSPLAYPQNGNTPRRYALSELNKAKTPQKQDEFMDLLEIIIKYSYKGNPAYTLHEAVVLNKIDVVKTYLNDKNTFLQAIDIEGYTALDYARKYNRVEIEKILVAAGVSR